MSEPSDFSYEESKLKVLGAYRENAALCVVPSNLL